MGSTRGFSRRFERRRRRRRRRKKNAATPRPPRTGRGRTRPRAPRPPRTGRGTRRRGYERSATPGSTRTWSPRRWRGRRRWSRRAPWRPRVSRRMRILRPAGRRRGTTPDIARRGATRATPATTRPPSPSSRAVETAVSEAERAFRTLETRSRDRAAAAASATQTRTIGKSPPPIAGGRRGGRARGAARGGGGGGGGARHGATRGLRVRHEGYSELPLRGRAGELSARVGGVHGRLTGARAMELDPPPSVNPTAGRRDGDDADGRRGVREARTPRTRTGVTNAGLRRRRRED